MYHIIAFDYMHTRVHNFLPRWLTSAYSVGLMMEYKRRRIDKVSLFLAIVVWDQCCVVAIELQHDLEVPN